MKHTYRTDARGCTTCAPPTYAVLCGTGLTYLAHFFHTKFGRKLAICQLRRGLQFHEEGSGRHFEGVLRDHWNPGWQGSLCGMCAVQLGTRAENEQGNRT